MDEKHAALNWPQILQKLAESDLNFVVVGGAALALHGIPRTTLDIDVFIPAETGVLAKISAVLESQLGLQAKVNTADLKDDPDLLMSQWLPYAIPSGPDIIDVFLCRPGDFYRLYQAADIIQIGGSDVWITDIESLREMKRKSNRAIDQADVILIDEFREFLEEQ